MNATTKPVPKRSKFFLLFGSIWLFIGLIFAFVGYLSYQNEVRYKKEGVTVPAVVLSKRIDVRRDKDNDKVTSYYVKYKFTTKTGQNLESESSVGSDRWETFKENDPVDIVYIESETRLNRIAGTTDTLAMWMFSGVGLFSILIGVGVIGYDMKARMLAKRLLTDGALVEAIVTQVGPGSLTINDVPQWRIRFNFKDMYGKSVDGQTAHLSPADAQQWKQGDKGKVRYDKQDPKKHIWVGA